ncbi:sulfate transporter family-domain-containing protein [Pseudomassariella vexata]|uniref:Sulfate transporter family-domain-containing protein n=1 Tax=Pseudomassariella vexata TaxID=1141098 RepID=A0A1Y2E509_9PEZI|nr:sulfate transporter family-domain-containing protein [Pseudomassariella vexata]ORY66376.1 sulfate transporter family-domain-containing protein [Pseudomassariella vexata]
MSSVPFGFTSWRRRSPSITSQPCSRDIPRTQSPSQVQRGQADARLLSSSVSSLGYREPTRSFIPGSARDRLSPVDSASYARSVREDTAELASYVLADKKDARSPSFLTRRTSDASYAGIESSGPYHESAGADDVPVTNAETIEEVSEPGTPDDIGEHNSAPGPSILASMIKSCPRPKNTNGPTETEAGGQAVMASPGYPPVNDKVNGSSETTPLLRSKSSVSCLPDSPELSDVDDLDDIESQKPRLQPWYHGYGSVRERTRVKVRGIATTMNPKTWDKKTAWQRMVMDPVSCMPAVVLGLLLNILDALSYGMILFPLGNPIFSSLGPAGISIFYVSTIVSQITFSIGSIFKGVVGSELIEVVPFFHSMAATITVLVGEDKPEAVIATTIVSYAMSSMMTGLAFWLLGKFKLGYIVGFIPRHILIGCIGGVGWFLLQTGVEVSARMDDFRYDLNTAKRLLQPDALIQWIIPLILAIILFVLQKKITSKYFVSAYILSIPLVFYFFVLSFDSLDPQSLRDSGWIFEAPRAGEPWWYFWSLYKFHLVDWSAVLQTVGAMFALTFFSLLHVPINVPALAQTTGEDNADLNHELKLHGYSNFIAGALGSMQNYLVYANSVFFMRSGGDSRLAGFMLAAFTGVVMVIGPVVIGYIPVMMVGTLIFVLGIELLADALVNPRHKTKLLEYLTILAIILTMGIYDFVAGIFLGIILAFVSVIVNQSRVSAIRATYTGDQVGSIVRRNPTQCHYLRQVSRQTYIIKLSGNLFFGTIVGVEKKIRDLVADDAFADHPIKYLIIDLWQVTGIDYSAAEGFMIINRLLQKRGVVLLISGKDADSHIGRDLRAVGLGESSGEVKFMPDLNSALESCENEQLKALYAQREALRVIRDSPSRNLDVPNCNKSVTSPTLDLLSQSPRRNHLNTVAKNVLEEHELQRAERWRSISEPIRLMLQIFHELSDKNEDFWFRAKAYFVRREYPAGTVLFNRGDSADGFYLLERGELRADYDMPQGKLSEPIVQGTTCGELPFFSQTERTATVFAVKDCVAWFMDRENWDRLRQQENDIYQELLCISLKLTTERMNAIGNYTLANAN